MNKNTMTGTTTFNGEDVIFNYCTSLNAEQKMKFVGEFGSLIVTDDDYYKVVSDMMFDFMVIRVFTNINTSFIEDDECENKILAIEAIVNETGIADIVKANADSGVIEELRESCELNVEYKTGIHRNLLDESLSELVQSFEKIISSVDMEEVMKIGKLFSEMQGEFTPEKMIEAFANTDIYKNNSMRSTFSSTLNAPKYEV